MLLSEVLDVVKKLKVYKPLNEAFASTMINTFFKEFEYSNLNYTPIYVDKKSYHYDSADGQTKWDIEYILQRELINNRIWLYDLLDPEKLKKIINIDYTVKKGISRDYKSRKTKGIVNKLRNTLEDRVSRYINLSEIRDSDLIKIDPADAKKKKYKSGLQFWVDYENKLRAVAIDTTVIMYIEKLYGKWLVVKDSYKFDVNSIGTYNDDGKFTLNKDELQNFIDEAFKEMPVYTVHTTPDSIKQKGIKNIKNLQELPGILDVYVVNESAMIKTDITEKVKSRRDYYKFLQEQKDINLQNLKRYKTQLKLNKNKGKDIKIYDNIINLIDLCFDSIDELYQTECDLILDMQDTDFAISQYISGIISFDFQQEIQKCAADDIFMSYMSSRERRPALRLRTIGDCFIIVNTFINVLIDKTQRLGDYIESYINKKDNGSVDSDTLVRELSLIENNYNSLKDYVKYAIHRIALLRPALECIQSKTDKVHNIIKKIISYKFI